MCEWADQPSRPRDFQVSSVGEVASATAEGLLQGDQGPCLQV